MTKTAAASAAPATKATPATKAAAPAAKAVAAPAVATATKAAAPATKAAAKKAPSAKAVVEAAPVPVPAPTPSVQAPAAAPVAAAKKATKSAKAVAAPTPAVATSETAPASSSDATATPAKTPSKRAAVTRESVDAEFEAILKLLTEEAEKCKLSDDKKKLAPFLLKISKNLSGIQKHASKVLNKRRSRSSKSSSGADGSPAQIKSPNSGFNKCVAITPALADFMGVTPDTLVSRTNGSKAFYAYIEKNGLKDSTNGQFINPDSKLASMLGFDLEAAKAEGKRLRYCDVNKLMQRHFATSSKAVTA